MKLIAKLTSEIHAALFYSNRIDKRRWAYKVSPSEWDALNYEMYKAQSARSFLTGSPPPAELVAQLRILGVDIITDFSLETTDVLKDYGSSG